MHLGLLEAYPDIPILDNANDPMFVLSSCLVNQRQVMQYNGQTYILNPSRGIWVSLEAKSGELALAMAAGTTNATANYGVAVAP